MPLTSRIIRYQHGFSLLEMAIVLAIIGFLLASLLIPLSAQIENGRLKENRAMMKQIRAAIEGFFIANRRFPCPSDLTSRGMENRNTSTGLCWPYEHGFLPSTTLGLSGTYNADGFLLDPWGHPYRYSVNGLRDFADDTDCHSSDGADNKPDLTWRNQLYIAAKNGCANLDFTVCSDSSCTRKLATHVPVVFFSLGKNWARTMDDPVSPNETANVSKKFPWQSPKIPGLKYYMHFSTANTNRFIAADYNPSNDANRFDDIVDWISLPVLYNKMVEAGIYNNL